MDPDEVIIIISDDEDESSPVVAANTAILKQQHSFPISQMPASSFSVKDPPRERYFRHGIPSPPQSHSQSPISVSSSSAVEVHLDSEDDKEHRGLGAEEVNTNRWFDRTQQQNQLGRQYEPQDSPQVDHIGISRSELLRRQRPISASSQSATELPSPQGTIRDHKDAVQEDTTQSSLTPSIQTLATHAHSDEAQRDGIPARPSTQSGQPDYSISRSILQKPHRPNTGFGRPRQSSPQLINRKRRFSTSASRPEHAARAFEPDSMKDHVYRQFHAPELAGKRPKVQHVNSNGPQHSILTAYSQNMPLKTNSHTGFNRSGACARDAHNRVSGGEAWTSRINQMPQQGLRENLNLPQTYDSMSTSAQALVLESETLKERCRDLRAIERVFRAIAQHTLLRPGLELHANEKKQVYDFSSNIIEQKLSGSRCRKRMSDIASNLDRRLKDNTVDAHQSHKIEEKLKQVMTPGWYLAITEDLPALKTRITEIREKLHQQRSSKPLLGKEAASKVRKEGSDHDLDGGDAPKRGSSGYLEALRMRLAGFSSSSHRKEVDLLQSFELGDKQPDVEESSDEDEDDPYTQSYQQYHGRSLQSLPQQSTPSSTAIISVGARTAQAPDNALLQEMLKRSKSASHPVQAVRRNRYITRDLDQEHSYEPEDSDLEDPIDVGEFHFWDGKPYCWQYTLNEARSDIYDHRVSIIEEQCGVYLDRKLAIDAAAQRISGFKAQLLRSRKELRSAKCSFTTESDDTLWEQRLEYDVEPPMGCRVWIERGYYYPKDESYKKPKIRKACEGIVLYIVEVTKKKMSTVQPNQYVDGEAQTMSNGIGAKEDTSVQIPDPELDNKSVDDLDYLFEEDSDTPPVLPFQDAPVRAREDGDETFSDRNVSETMPGAHSAFKDDQGVIKNASVTSKVEDGDGRLPLESGLFKPCERDNDDGSAMLAEIRQVVTLEFGSTDDIAANDRPTEDADADRDDTALLATAESVSDESTMVDNSRISKQSSPEIGDNDLSCQSSAHQRAAHDAGAGPGLGNGRKMQIFTDLTTANLHAKEIYRKWLRAIGSENDKSIASQVEEAKRQLNFADEMGCWSGEVSWTVLDDDGSTQTEVLQVGVWETKAVGPNN